MNFELMTAEVVPLCDELEACYAPKVIQGLGAIRHPLVYSVPHFPQMNAMMNASLAAKQKYVAEALAEGDYSKAIMMHERPFRFDALHRYGRKMADAAFWESFGFCWTDSENIWENHEVVRYWLASDRPGREAMMDDTERLMLGTLPDKIPVWRGHQSKNRTGFSWTLNPEKARWFARRWDRRGAAVTSGTIDRGKVIALLTGRGEDEIVCRPLDVKEKGTVKL